ncbi:hypothetical protein LCGC14_2684700, partial [marine sediment metagenome]
VSAYKAPALGVEDLKIVEKEAKAGGRIRSISPKLLEPVDVNKKKVLLAGVDLAAERRVKKWWLVEAGRYPSKADEVFVGQNAADKIGVEAGDDIVVGDHTLRVAGILMETGSQDDSLIFLDLEKLRSIVDKTGQISLIEVAAKRTEDVKSLAKSLQSSLPKTRVQSVKQAVEYKESTLGHLARFGLGVTLVVILISALVVFTTMASAVNERRVEIGIFRAIGFRKSKIALIVLTEVLILGIVSGIIGYGLGFGIAWVLPFVTEATIVGLRPSLLLIMLSVLLSVGIGLTVSVVPAWRAANLDPVESIKSL